MAMEFPIRLERAIQKLYDAFHNDHLIPECPCRCAVGNVCDKNDFWKHFTNDHGSATLNYVGKVNELFRKKFYGYSPLELLKLENEFLKGCGFSVPLNARKSDPQNQVSKDVLFEGLSAAVSYLCRLDHIPDVMDYSRLFDFQQNSPASVAVRTEKFRLILKMCILDIETKAS